MTIKIAIGNRINGLEASLYWATIEHVRSWLLEDGPFRSAIEARNGVLTGGDVRHIAAIYNVGRFIPSGKEGGLADLINNEHWAKDPIERARQCYRLATKAKNRHYTTNKTQWVMMTKLSWFAEPDGWTVCDRLVRRSTGAKDVKDFYQKLTCQGFFDLANQIQTQLDLCPLFKRLHGPRVLDKFLMLIGMKLEATGAVGHQQEKANQSLIRFHDQPQRFLAVLPRDWSSSIESLASRVEQSVKRAQLSRLLGDTVRGKSVF